ncbi:MAG TPA: hypothetical protein VJX67_23335, partial [Blastocatellia bacterium]|nr:hypothetical protein [Blastocatellia bacterium]
PEPDEKKHSQTHSQTPSPTNDRRDRSRPSRRISPVRGQVAETIATTAGAGSESTGNRGPKRVRLLNAATADHLDSVAVLLRSFKNSGVAEGSASAGIAYDREQSRRILSANILLRQEAESRGNLPVLELLGDLEPFLLDIANLPAKPSRGDVKSITDRIQKDEILVSIEAYSAPAQRAGF